MNRGHLGGRIIEWAGRLAADPRRGERSASVLGLALAVSFGVCLATGVYSHLAQHPPAWFTLLAPRDPDTGPQGFPVNRSAGEAGVIVAALDPAWRLRVDGALARPTIWSSPPWPPRCWPRRYGASLALVLAAVWAVAGAAVAVRAASRSRRGSG